MLLTLCIFDIIRFWSKVSCGSIFATYFRDTFYSFKPKLLFCVLIFEIFNVRLFVIKGLKVCILILKIRIIRGNNIVNLTTLFRGLFSTKTLAAILIQQQNSGFQAKKKMAKIKVKCCLDDVTK